MSVTVAYNEPQLLFIVLFIYYSIMAFIAKYVRSSLYLISNGKKLHIIAPTNVI